MVKRIINTGVTTLIVMLALTVFNGGRVVDWALWWANYLFVWLIAVLVSSALKR